MGTSVYTPQAISVEKVRKSRLSEVDFKNLTFGSTFADHMLVADVIDGAWQAPKIVPYGSMTLNPTVSGLHYGQTIYEGMKAFATRDGDVRLFRPDAHLRRLNRSAVRLSMPEVPQEIFMDGLMELLRLDNEWVPRADGGSLYIRPIYFANDDYIGMRAALNYKFIIFASPVMAYYNAPLRVWVTQDYTRAAPGGVGYVKTAGNYAPALLLNKLARENGFNVVLWLDGLQHRYVEEYSTMNAFFVIGDDVVTPKNHGTFLEGVTRDSIMRVLRDEGLNVYERDISMEELFDMAESGALTEAFGSGTAAVVASAEYFELAGRGFTLPDRRPIAELALERLHEIRSGRRPDPYGWMVGV